MLVVKDLCAWYGKMQILFNVNLKVESARIVAIVGPNGAGKSTVLKSITGFVHKRTGTFTFDNESIINIKTQDLISKGICFIQQGRSVFSALSVQENLQMGAYKFPDANLDQMYNRFPLFASRKHQKAGLLSGGEQQLLCFARALIAKPQLLIVDEPSIGLDPKTKKMIFENIKMVCKEDKVSVLMVEQNVRQALSIADYAYVLESGKNRLEGTGKELLNNKDVAHLYLGGVIR